MFICKDTIMFVGGSVVKSFPFRTRKVAYHGLFRLTKNVAKLLQLITDIKSRRLLWKIAPPLYTRKTEILNHYFRSVLFTCFQALSRPIVNLIYFSFKVFYYVYLHASDYILRNKIKLILIYNK